MAAEEALSMNSSDLPIRRNWTEIERVVDSQTWPWLIGHAAMKVQERLNAAFDIIPRIEMLSFQPKKLQAGWYRASSDLEMMIRKVRPPYIYAWGCYPLHSLKKEAQQNCRPLTLVESRYLVECFEKVDSSTDGSIIRSRVSIQTESYELRYAKRLQDTPNCNESSKLSEVLSCEIVCYMIQAYLEETELEVRYIDRDPCKVDYVVKTTDNALCGVSVTRAFMFQDTQAGFEQPFKLCLKKRKGLQVAASSAFKKWKRKILHILTTSSHETILVFKLIKLLKDSHFRDIEVFITEVESCQADVFGSNYFNRVRHDKRSKAIPQVAASRNNNNNIYTMKKGSEEDGQQRSRSLESEDIIRSVKEVGSSKNSSIKRYNICVRADSYDNIPCETLLQSVLKETPFEVQDRSGEQSKLDYVIKTQKGMSAVCVARASCFQDSLNGALGMLELCLSKLSVLQEVAFTDAKTDYLKAKILHVVTTHPRESLFMYNLLEKLENSIDNYAALYNDTSIIIVRVKSSDMEHLYDVSSNKCRASTNAARPRGSRRKALGKIEDTYARGLN